MKVAAFLFPADFADWRRVPWLSAVSAGKIVFVVGSEEDSCMRPEAAIAKHSEDAHSRQAKTQTYAIYTFMVTYNGPHTSIDHFCMLVDAANGCVPIFPALYAGLFTLNPLQGSYYRYSLGNPNGIKCE